MRRMKMVKILFLFCVFLNILPHATKEEGEKNFSQGEYKIKKLKSAATATIEVVATQNDIMRMYTTGDIVYVVEVQELKKAKRIRGKLDNGLWISLKNTQNEACWAKRLKNKIIEEPSQNVIKKTLTNIYTKAKENLKLPAEECMVCYERFPVSLKFNCGHELCAVCFGSILKKCDNKNCPKCRAPMDPPLTLTELILMIHIHPLLITTQISPKHLQHSFPLICAVANLRTVTKCINMGVDVNKTGLNGWFPLQCALENNINVVKYLVEKAGANVNPISESAVTPLTTCSGNGNLLVVKYLIKQGANVNPIDPKGTPLLMSSQQGHLNVVKYLIQNGAKVNQHFIVNGVTPLLMGCQYGNLELVKYLIKNGANVNQVFDNGVTPLFVISRNNFLTIVQSLVENKADVNQARDDGSTPLLECTQNGYWKIFQYLIKNGANVNQANNEGVTPLLISSQIGNLAMVKYLIKNGANVNQISMDAGVTPLSVSSQNGHLSIVEYLVHSGANINQPRHDGSTPLFWAFYYKHTEVVQFLVSKNANIESTKLFVDKVNSKEI